MAAIRRGCLGDTLARLINMLAHPDGELSHGDTT